MLLMLKEWHLFSTNPQSRIPNSPNIYDPQRLNPHKVNGHAAMIPCSAFCQYVHTGADLLLRGVTSHSSREQSTNPRLKNIPRLEICLRTTHFLFRGAQAKIQKKDTKRHKDKQKDRKKATTFVFRTSDSCASIRPVPALFGGHSSSSHSSGQSTADLELTLHGEGEAPTSSPSTMQTS